MSNILYLRNSNRGMGNTLLNIVTLLVWITSSNEYDKLVLILSKRKDDITNFCETIDNEKILITYEQPPDSNLLNIKDFMKANYWQRIYGSINNNSPDIKSLKNPIRLFNSVFPTKEQLLSVKKYFNLQPNKHINEKLESLKKDNYVALHVRMTDFVTAIMKTTEDKVSYEPYYNFVSESNCKYIYLATDNRKTQDIFINKYGDRVFFYELIDESQPVKLGGNHRYTTAESLYVDLFMCRDADKFMGTNQSTFSDFIKVLRFNKKYH